MPHDMRNSVGKADTMSEWTHILLTITNSVTFTPNLKLANCHFFVTPHQT